MAQVELGDQEEPEEEVSFEEEPAYNKRFNGYHSPSDRKQEEEVAVSF